MSLDAVASSKFRQVVQLVLPAVPPAVRQAVHQVPEIQVNIVIPEPTTHLSIQIQNVGHVT